MVSGFHQPHLISFLSELGVDVDCIIKVQSEEYSPDEEEASAPSPPQAAAMQESKTDMQQGTGSNCSATNVNPRVLQYQLKLELFYP